jgi:putative Mg2+ transporter-C (MgtC) family protein
MDMPMTMYDQIELLIPVLIAMVLGGLIGLEREMQSKPAGLRTHIFVAVSSTLLVLVGPPLVRLYSSGFPLEIIRNEPLSIVQAIIVGIGFIGAGTIVRSDTGQRVMNLTTAGTILFAGTVGVLVGARLYYLAAEATLGLLAINLLLQMFEARVIQRRKVHDDSLVVKQ